jgi:tRNA 2-thiouridine synthesizing protein A
MPTESLNPSRTIDTSGQCCPVPIVETNRAIKAMQPGEVLELVATDIGARMDIPAWCGRTGHELIRVEDAGGKLRFYVRKRGYCGGMKPDERA